MTRERKVQLYTVLLIGGLVGVLLARRGLFELPRRGFTKESDTPQDTVYAMLEAARQGDVDTYLSFFEGQVRAALERAVREQGKQQFSDYLRRSNQAIKGIAIAEPERLAPDTVRVRVEYVYSDRNEAQLIELRLVNGKWLIGRLGEIQRVPTPIPYGTPVE